MTCRDAFMVALAVALCAGAAPRATRQDSGRADLPSRLLGNWTGSGTVTGRASELSMSWDRAVGDAFVRLRFRNRMAASADRPAEVFEGHGYYRLSGGAGGSGVWFDSRGVMLPVRVSITADAFTSEWGSETTERGRTVYRLLDDGTLEVLDFVRAADGTEREFGRSRLRRAAGLRSQARA